VFMVPGVFVMRAEVAYDWRQGLMADVSQDRQEKIQDIDRQSQVQEGRAWDRCKRRVGNCGSKCNDKLIRCAEKCRTKKDNKKKWSESRYQSCLINCEGRLFKCSGKCVDKYENCVKEN